MTEPQKEDVFNILLATDIHLGFNEKDPIRGEDSFNTFEEILQLAQENEVDFVLLGGDLFHDTRPSAECLYRCMALLRKYCLGDRPISFEFLSDQEKIFEHSSQEVVNYEDPNINVSIPVFSIHGNHDDPTGQKMICSLDILSSAGFVNYFGKTIDLEEVSVSPLLMQKGETLLSIYGLSHIKDARLARLFEQEKVTFYKPDEYLDKWFNICVLHQNRPEREKGRRNYIPEEALPCFLDFVLWGHEHDCRITPEWNPKKGFYVSQPGSSVATSLSSSEAMRKKVAVLKVHKKNFKLQAIDLQTVRPFILKDICVSELDLDPMLEASEQFEQKAEEEVLNMIEEAKELLSGHSKQPKLPLIRLGCMYTNPDQMFNAIRFGQKFEEKVANPSDIILLKKRHELMEKRDVLAGDTMKKILSRGDAWEVRVEDYVKKYFRDVDDVENYRMNVLTVAGLNLAITSMVDKNDNSAIEETVNYQSSRMEKYLVTKDVDKDNIDDEIRNFYVQRAEKTESETEEIRSHLQGADRSVRKAQDPKPLNGHGNVVEDPAVIDDEDEEEAAKEPASGVGRGRGRGGGRGSRGYRAPRDARTPRASRAASKATSRTASTLSTRGRASDGQRTLQDSFNSQISVVRTSARSTANRSRVVFEEDDDD